MTAFPPPAWADVHPPEAQPLPWWRRIAAWGSILLVGVVAAAIGLWLRHRISGPAPEVEAATTPAAIGASIVVSVALGVVHLVVGGAAYLLIRVTHAFTFRFDHPVYRGYTRRLWVANILVSLLLFGGLAMLAAAVVGPIAVMLGASVTQAFGMSALGVFLMLQLVGASLNLWNPVTLSLIRRRLAARGIPELQLQHGVLMGTSDPSSSTLRRMVVEQDVGVMWVLSDSLQYMGDAGDWVLPREAVMAVERGVDAGNMTSHVGGRDVLVHFAQPDGVEARIRLHPMGACTLGGEARLLDWLAEYLRRWHTYAPPQWPRATSADSRNSYGPLDWQLMTQRRGESTSMPLLRPETDTDHLAIRQLCDAAFGGPVEGQIVDRLRRDGDLTISLVAEEAGEVVGHVALSPLAMEPETDLRGLGLGPVAVRPDRQRRGIGSALVREALHQAEQAGWGLVVVLGDPDYYRRFGFGPAEALQITSQYSDTGAFQARMLASHAPPPVPLFVRYAPAFDEA